MIPDRIVLYIFLKMPLIYFNPSRAPRAACTYASVEQLNRDEIGPILDDIVQTPFFRYFKVDLYCDCPFWPDDGMCAMRQVEQRGGREGIGKVCYLVYCAIISFKCDSRGSILCHVTSPPFSLLARGCSVCECEDHEVPELWRQAEARAAPGAACVEEAVAEAASALDRSLQPEERQRLVSVRDWRGYRNPWMPEADDADAIEYSYINLQATPERYTGDAGPHAGRVWAAIYEQPALRADPSAVPELRVFYRLVSGVHASISAHLASDYLLDEAAGTWGPNLAEFQRRLGTPAVRDRVENLYFAYLFVLRAVMKAEPLLRDAEYATGLPAEDAATARAVRRLLDNAALRQACPIPFDEGRLWKGEDAELLRDRLRQTFQNMTRVMDCVGCEKCKMWGKLQFLGLATSLKILFSAEDCGGGGCKPHPPLQLERNEVIALVNLLERLSNSVETVRVLSLQLAEGQHPQGLGAIQDVVHDSLPEALRGEQVSGDQAASSAAAA